MKTNGILKRVAIYNKSNIEQDDTLKLLDSEIMPTNRQYSLADWDWDIGDLILSSPKCSNGIIFPSRWYVIVDSSDNNLSDNKSNNDKSFVTICSIDKQYERINCDIYSSIWTKLSTQLDYLNRKLKCKKRKSI